MEESGVGDPPLLLIRIYPCYKSNIYCCCFLQLVYVIKHIKLFLFKHILLYLHVIGETYIVILTHVSYVIGETYIVILTHFSYVIGETCIVILTHFFTCYESHIYCYFSSKLYCFTSYKIHTCHSQQYYYKTNAI